MPYFDFFLQTQTLGLTLSTIGEIVLAGTVLVVHTKLKQERKIDQYVINEITLEQFLGTTSILLIILGYLIQIGFFSLFQ